MIIADGSYTLTPKADPSKQKKYTIDPDVIQLICNVPIASASGDLQKTDIHDGKTPIIFDNDDPSHQHIFLG